MKKLLTFLLFSACFTIVSFAQDKIAKGTKVTILEIASDDSYYSERADFLGSSATALGELTKKSSGFYSGTLETDKGRTCFFTAVKVSVTGAPVKSKTTDASLFSGSSIPKGTRFTVIEVPSDDAYYSDKDEIEGQSGTTDSELKLEDGYTGGSIKLDNGKSYYFYKVKIGKYNAGASAKSSPVTTSKTTAKTPKYVTGTIKKGTVVYVADISPDDSYYSDRADKIGKRGKVTKSDMPMKEDGYYAGDFEYDDGTTAYFYKAKFSKEPVGKIESTKKVENTDILNKYDWDDAENDDDISEGDIVEVTAVSEEDSYYDDRDDYIGQQGVAGDDLEYDAESGGYGGTVALDNGDEPYFYLVKLKKVSSASSSKSSSSSSSTISKGTRVKVTDVHADDSFYSNRKAYIGKSGKVADGLTAQGSGCYSGKIVFDDGTDAYFYKVKVTVIK